MLNINADSVVLTKAEYMVLLEDAMARRRLCLTRDECDAIIFASRKIMYSDVVGNEQAQKHAEVLINIAKKLEGY